VLQERFDATIHFDLRPYDFGVAHGISVKFGL